MAESASPPSAAKRFSLGWLALALIATALLSPAERAWIQSYHARVYAEVAPLCDPPVREWLRIATLPLD